MNFIYDAVGGKGFAGNFDMLAPMGTVVMFGQIAGAPDPDVLTPMLAHMGRCAGLRVFSIHVLDDQPDVRRGAMEQALAALAAGDVAPRIHARLPLGEAADAHRLLETGGVTGKVVLVP